MDNVHFVSEIAWIAAGGSVGFVILLVLVASRFQLKVRRKKAKPTTQALGLLQVRKQTKILEYIEGFTRTGDRRYLEAAQLLKGGRAPQLAESFEQQLMKQLVTQSLERNKSPLEQMVEMQQMRELMEDFGGGGGSIIERGVTALLGGVGQILGNQIQNRPEVQGALSQRGGQPQITEEPPKALPAAQPAAAPPNVSQLDARRMAAATVKALGELEPEAFIDWVAQQQYEPVAQALVTLANMPDAQLPVALTIAEKKREYRDFRPVFQWLKKPDNRQKAHDIINAVRRRLNEDDASDGATPPSDEPPGEDERAVDESIEFSESVL